MTKLLSLSASAHPNLPTMSSFELLDLINQARAAAGETEVRRNDFTARCVDELEGEHYETFVVTNSNGTRSEALRLTVEQCLQVAMRESKAVRRAVREKLKQQETAQPTLKDPRVEALGLIPNAVRAARAFGFDKNVAAISANQLVYKITGANVLQLMGQTHLEAERQDTQWFTPTELGQRIGLSAKAFNLRLASAGFQVKVGSAWEVTDAGKPHARLLDTGKSHGNGVPVVQIKWSPKVLGLLELAA